MTIRDKFGRILFVIIKFYEILQGKLNWVIYYNIWKYIEIIIVEISFELTNLNYTIPISHNYFCDFF